MTMAIGEIARVCHEANRAYCVAHGDTSQPSWDEAPEWQKASARNGVIHALSNPDATPEDSHKSWLRAKEAEGWIYGEIKDPEKKQHPCFRPYAELPADQRKKDELFLAVVRALR